MCTKGARSTSEHMGRNNGRYARTIVCYYRLDKSWHYNVDVRAGANKQEHDEEGLEVEQCGLWSEIPKSEDIKRTCTMALFEPYDQLLGSGRPRARGRVCVEACQ